MRKSEIKEGVWYYCEFYATKSISKIRVGAIPENAPSILDCVLPEFDIFEDGSSSTDEHVRPIYIDLSDIKREATEEEIERFKKAYIERRKGSTDTR